MSSALSGFTELVIIDPGYVHPHAHHQGVNLSIANALRHEEMRTRIFASRELDPGSIGELESSGIEYERYFETPCYPANAECLAPQDHEKLQREFANELMQLFHQRKLSGEEPLLLHTAFSFHYLGLARALWHVRHFMKAPVLICPMFNPGAGLKPGNYSIEVHDARAFIRHKLTFRLLGELKRRHGLNIEIGTSCHSYQRLYQKLWKGGQISIHPAISFRAPEFSQVASGDGRRRVLLYFGGVKSSKGFEFAASLGAAAAREFANLRFSFHFNDDFPGAQHFADRVTELEEAGKKHDNVEIFRGNLTNKEYDGLLGSSDVVMILYDPVHYRHKTSGVFWDALRFENKSWIVTSETWPEAELDELGIDHASIQFGDIQGGIRAIEEWAHSTSKMTDKGIGRARNSLYLRRLMRPFGDWVAETIAGARVGAPAVQPSRTRPSILVVRTNYGHFSDLSGPGGFVPYLRNAGLNVEEIKVDLGAENVSDVPRHVTGQVRQSTSRFLSSYQLNSVPIETAIQRNAHRYDVVHFVDGEHCGLLSALFRKNFPHLGRPALIATFHQPSDILAQLIKAESWLHGFDRIHLMSPDQAEYFDDVVAREKLVAIPHGIARQLLDSDAVNGDQSFECLMANILPPKVAEKKILLTVGSWLRDFDTLLETAQKLTHRADLHFVIVSKGLDLPAARSKNLTLVGQGVSDEQLGALYRQASLLFLPLKSGAANNALLEAMANGLPIISTDLPAVHYYSGGLARTGSASAKAYVRLVEEALAEFNNSAQRQEMAKRLKERATSLSWPRVAVDMYENLYVPFLGEFNLQQRMHPSRSFSMAESNAHFQ